MLVGLLFAIETVEEGAPTLVACLPFAGSTLIEHQARRLIAAGAGQIVVIAREPSPALNGAIGRIERRDVVVDLASGAAEAAARIHPLARVLVLADALMTSDAVVAPFAGIHPGDALLTVAGDAEPSTYERIGRNHVWAGIAQLEAARLGEAARLPADYDPQSTLLRVAEAAGAAHLPLGAAADGHGIGRSPAALQARERKLIGLAAAGARRGWFDRWIRAPLVGLALPRLAAAGVPTAAVGTSAVLIAILGGGGLLAGWPRSGMMLAWMATMMAAIAIALAALRDEPRLARLGEAAERGIAAVAVLLLGRWVGWVRADSGPVVTALALIAAAALAERARVELPARWWGGAPAYLAVVTLATLAGWPTLGLALAACYAAASLAASIEGGRQGLAPS